MQKQNHMASFTAQPRMYFGRELLPLFPVITFSSFAAPGFANIFAMQLIAMRMQSIWLAVGNPSR
jgi:hypothetical protein